MKMAMCTQQLNCLIWIDCFVLTLESLFNCVHSFLCAILQKKKRFINTHSTNADKIDIHLLWKVSLCKFWIYWIHVDVNTNFDVNFVFTPKFIQNLQHDKGELIRWKHILHVVCNRYRHYQYNIDVQYLYA